MIVREYSAMTFVDETEAEELDVELEGASDLFDPDDELLTDEMRRALLRKPEARKGSGGDEDDGDELPDEDERNPAAELSGPKEKTSRLDPEHPTNRFDPDKPREKTNRAEPSESSCPKCGSNAVEAGEICDSCKEEESGD